MDFWGIGYSGVYWIVDFRNFFHQYFGDREYPPDNFQYFFRNWHIHHDMPAICQRFPKIK